MGCMEGRGIMRGNNDNKGSDYRNVLICNNYYLAWIKTGTVHALNIGELLSAYEYLKWVKRRNEEIKDMYVYGSEWAAQVVTWGRKRSSRTYLERRRRRLEREGLLEERWQ